MVPSESGLQMIYGLLKFIISTSLKVFLGEYQYTIMIEAPENGPVIFVCNHPNLVNRRMACGHDVQKASVFLAKSTIFKGKFATWLLTRLGIIPV